ncbi:UDP-N-acetylglucosamine--N-acetylmuramyl-(pentapeptide) pyrophosphoryl-undecaprenol N-acetylglucosamine transferase [Paramagnetospirillum magnetotacticum MS-1]|uniref:UDP-N-acetylglucosamine--N-acetylmuramyl-(pentapeptide) pyrophosphoryl-undecaprenol N-acetylglucosamine transferase n=1 Tax=Paramagnetospirillum magnetotacticum MS-1 TaxID=272627 RepID=A0A0C2YQ58_PARME|nr:undecaprenyldiphospho-muramoylpentapeptide beta-N-acetylglucosaminyltransferase [Paramagnetospirillum magnetotacticum]KIL96800.1 UDP-N-acetylglucosamine--N-acetylmuramyl-(pentapeptide) pyrophosphoryl-undecaprenol N-acetylglucosamine transferase [Paramagnetospirillum magnetotacticum MS-1]
MSKPLIALSAGGTGGHVFPAEALASVLLERGYHLALITDKRGAAYGGTLGKLETFRISAGSIAGRGKLKVLRSALELGVGLIQARSILKRIRPAAMIGFGGYASVPGMAAAALAGIPTAIHEQNAVLGRANRLLAGHVRRIATSFAEVSHVEPKLTQKLVHTGMPVRAGILACRDTAYAEIGATGPIELLVLGGSQGARILSEVVPAALARLPEPLRTRIRISQQCRPEDLDAVRRAYEGTGIDATLESFFADVPERLAGAHLVIARAGASTVAELTTLGRPAILVPYPFAIDDHQTANAHAAEDCGGAWLMQQDSFSPESLADRLQSLFTHPEALTRTAACARNVGRPDAAEALADLVVGLIPKTSGA